MATCRTPRSSAQMQQQMWTLPIFFGNEGSTKMATIPARSYQAPASVDTLNIVPEFAVGLPPMLEQSLAERDCGYLQVVFCSAAGSCFVEISASPSHDSSHAQFIGCQFDSPGSQNDIELNIFGTHYTMITCCHLKVKQSTHSLTF